MLIRIITEAIWPCIEASVDHFAASRADTVAYTVRAGTNFSIILGSACYIEGTLETLLHSLLEYRSSVYGKVDIPDFETRRSMNIFYSRLEDDLSVRIARSLGSEGYDDMFELLIGTPLHMLRDVKPLWEAITVLFNFRNVLGHGRQVRARQFSGGAVPGGFREEFSGSYRRVEDYLRKVGLIKGRFPEGASEYVLLTDEIADHFWGIAKQVPASVISSLLKEQSEVCANAFEVVRRGMDCYYKRFAPLLTTNDKQEQAYFYKVNNGMTFLAFADQNTKTGGFARDLFIDLMRCSYSKGSISYISPRIIGLEQFPEEDAVFSELFEEYREIIRITYEKTRKFLELSGVTNSGESSTSQLIAVPTAEPPEDDDDTD